MEDGRKALFLPGSNKESFTLGRYQEEVGKDFKRITLFLCPELDYQISEGNFHENDLSDFENDGTDSPNKRRKWEIDLTCEFDCQTNSKHDCLDNDQELEQSLQVEADHPPQQDQKPGHGPSERDLERHQQLEQDQQFASDLQRIYDAEDIIVPKDDNSSMISDSSSVVTFLGKQVDQSSQLFVVMRRGAPLNRVLSIWSREVKKNSTSVKQTVRVHFSGEEGIDSGALAKEFFTMTLPKIGSVIFPNGQPVDSTFNVHNGNFKACGEIVAASIAQGGPAPRFLQESVHGLMANPNVPLQELDMGRHLTATDRELLNTIRDDIAAHTDTIVEHGYTGSINASHIEEIISSVAISLVSKRLVYLKEFVDRLDAYGLRSIIQTHPEACKPLFVQDVSSHDAVDANYLFSSLCPEYAPEGSTRREVEESMMDFLQDFLFHLEDDPNVNVSGYAEPLASCENTGIEVAESHEELLLPDLTPAGVMGWLTGQKHKPITGEKLNITVKFDHDCAIRNPIHHICFPVVGACAKEITFPVAHMKTEKAFNEVLMLALSKGQSFSMA